MPHISVDVWALIIGVAALVIGLPAFLFGLPQLTGTVQSLWTRRRIAVFGPPDAGKTTFIRYLRGEAAPRFHIPTIGSKVYGRISLDLTGDKSIYFSASEVTDVGGEFRQQWIAVSRRRNPHGIVYVVDTTKLDLEIAGLQHLLSTYRDWLKEKLRHEIHLQSILIIINKMDKWTESVTSEKDVLAEYGDRLGPILAEFDSMMGVSVRWKCASLIDARSHQDINLSLREFSSDMDEAGRRRS